MAQRWSINEDIIICLYCMGHPGAYSNVADADHIAHLLQEAGYDVEGMFSLEASVQSNTGLMLLR